MAAEPQLLDHGLHVVGQLPRHPHVEPVGSELVMDGRYQVAVDLLGHAIRRVLQLGELLEAAACVAEGLQVLYQLLFGARCHRRAAGQRGVRHLSPRAHASPLLHEHVLGNPLAQGPALGQVLDLGITHRELSGLLVYPGLQRLYLGLQADVQALGILLGVHQPVALLGQLGDLALALLCRPDGLSEHLLLPGELCLENGHGVLRVIILLGGQLHPQAVVRCG